MPIHKVRKRYVLFSWQKDSTPLIRHQLAKFLEEANLPGEGGVMNQAPRLMIIDTDIGMGIIKTTHRIVSRLKSHLEEGTEASNMPKFKVVAVSGTIKKLKSRLSKQKTSA